MIGAEADAASATRSRADEILERSSVYFEQCLWESEVGDATRSRLSRAGIEARTLRAFGVGYAPGDTQLLLANLEQWSYTPAELTAAGIATTSDRNRLHVLFHARIMFPIGDTAGRVLGFAGLATHLGPSWPLWLTSPDQGSFDVGSAIFGIEQARAEIARANRALVLRDPVQVLALHQQGRREAVAVVHSPITRAHLDQLAFALGAGDLHLARRDGRLGVVAVPNGAEVREDAFALRSTPAGFALIDSTPRPQPAGIPERSVPDIDQAPTPAPARALVYLGGALVGTGIPIGLLVAAPDSEAARGSTPALNLVIVGVAVAYLVLTLIVARISARHRATSKARRMREPWARGSGEWQPAGWTYHRLEEILVGAALASAVTCVVLLMTLGGFLG